MWRPARGHGVSNIRAGRLSGPRVLEPLLPGIQERVQAALRALLELQIEHVIVPCGPIHTRAAHESVRDPWSG